MLNLLLTPNPSPQERGGNFKLIKTPSPVERVRERYEI